MKAITTMNTMNPTLRNFVYRKLPVRVVMIDGEPWFVAKDVCDVLEIKQPVRAVAGLDDDEVIITHVTDSVGRNQEMLAASEPGLYSLILRSRKPEAKQFKRWITHDVIPSIRKTGKYVEKAAVAQEADSLSTWDMLQLALQGKVENEQLQARVQELVPKEQFYDRVIDSPSSFSLGETAKMLGYRRYGRNNLIDFLRWDGILMADNIAMQRYIDRGYFAVVQRDFVAPDGSVHIRAVTRVYEKGVDFIRRRLDRMITVRYGGTP